MNYPLQAIERVSSPVASAGDDDDDDDDSDFSREPHPLYTSVDSFLQRLEHRWAKPRTSSTTPSTELDQGNRHRWQRSLRSTRPAFMLAVFSAATLGFFMSLISLALALHPRSLLLRLQDNDAMSSKTTSSTLSRCASESPTSSSLQSTPAPVSHSRRTSMASQPRIPVQEPIGKESPSTALPQGSVSHETMPSSSASVVLSTPSSSSLTSSKLSKSDSSTPPILSSATSLCTTLPSLDSETLITRSFSCGPNHDCVLSQEAQRVLPSSTEEGVITAHPRPSPLAGLGHKRINSASSLTTEIGEKEKKKRSFMRAWFKPRHPKSTAGSRDKNNSSTDSVSISLSHNRRSPPAAVVVLERRDRHYHLGGRGMKTVIQ